MINNPKFIIIGGQKCGTTFFYNGICKHPKIKEAATKEVQYFEYQYHKGLNWYKSQFPSNFISGESSTAYMIYPQVPFLIKKDIKNVLIIALLRNPIDRAYSQYQMNVRNKIEKLSFEEAIKYEIKRMRRRFGKNMPLENIYESEYLSRGLYVYYLLIWKKLYSDMIIIKFEDMIKNPQKYWNDIFARLNLKLYKVNIQDVVNSIPKNRYKLKYSSMKESTRKKLESFFELPNKILYEITKIKW